MRVLIRLTAPLLTVVRPRPVACVNIDTLTGVGLIGGCLSNERSYYRGMHILRAAISLYILLLPNYGSAQELRVLTSFPPDFSSAYTAMWQARETETEIRVLNKKHGGSN